MADGIANGLQSLSLSSQNQAQNQGVSQQERGDVNRTGVKRKLFVGGLGWETHDDMLRKYFEQYGALAHCEVLYHRETGMHRGFGFVTFADEAAAIAAVEQRHHTINNKTAEVKFAVDRGDERLVTEAFEDKLAKQIFVGGIPKDTTPDELKEWAGNTFGHDKVISAIVVLDLVTKRPRGFGFVSFQTPEMVDQILQNATMDLENCPFRSDRYVQVKRARDRGPEQLRPTRRERGGGRKRGGRKRGGKNNEARLDVEGQWAQSQFFPGGMIPPSAYIAPYNSEMPQGTIMVPQQLDGVEVPTGSVPYMTYTPVPVMIPGQMNSPPQAPYPHMGSMFPMPTMPVQPGTWVPVAAPVGPTGAPVMMYPTPVREGEYVSVHYDDGEAPGQHEAAPVVTPDDFQQNYPKLASTQQSSKDTMPPNLQKAKPNAGSVPPVPT